MAIVYPLTLPTASGAAKISLSATNVVASQQSPFTLSSQEVLHQGAAWGASIALPPLKRVRAEPWITFLLKLKGSYGRFLLGDPTSLSPAGSASATSGVPLVKGASQVGDDLIIDGLPTSVTGYLLEGDYIQIDTGANATLHKILIDANTSSAGEATVTVWPRVNSPADNAVVAVNNTVGLFKLTTNKNSWDIPDPSGFFYIAFAAESVQ